MTSCTPKVLITGGAGGIGSAIASELLECSAHVLLVDRDAAALRSVSQRLQRHKARLGTFAADLTSPADRARLAEHAKQWHGGIDVLINNAGLNHFRLFQDQPVEQIDAALAVNVQAPLHLCHALLPHLLHQSSAHIVNIGSVFGTIGYPGYATYSATKFALRGFSEALRRELADTPIGVHYIAPRATRTPINAAAVEQMNQELGVAMDPPERVAQAVCALLRKKQCEAVVGWPEKLFARVNAIVPRIVDRAIRRKLPVIQQYARQSKPLPQASPQNSPTPATLRRNAT